MSKIFKYLGYIYRACIIFYWPVSIANWVMGEGDEFPEGSLERSGAGLIAFILVIFQLLWVTFLCCLPFIIKGVFV